MPLEHKYTATAGPDYSNITVAQEKYHKTIRGYWQLFKAEIDKSIQEIQENLSIVMNE